MLVTLQNTKQTTPNAVDAIWELVLCQTKSVQRALTKRFVALDAEERQKRVRTNVATPELERKLDIARQEIKDGKGITCRNKEELHSFLEAL